MSVYHEDEWLAIHQGDCRQVMAEMPEKFVQTVVTSPPYWGLRDYGVGGQLGLEATPEEYVRNMIEVFRGVRRVLRDDGTVWLNLGDTFLSSGGQRTYGSSDGGTGRGPGTRRHDVAAAGLKPKDLVGIPWRVAFALQSDGWYLRSDIIWAKPNPMPESVTDRPTKAHEYLFLLTKSPRYYYDADAIKDEAIHAGVVVKSSNPLTAKNGMKGKYGATAAGFTQHDTLVATHRNARTVWTIATQPYPGAHFATMPEALVEPCVKAGSSERGQCSMCGRPYQRDVDHKPMVIKRSERTHEKGQTRASGSMVDPGHRRTTGWSARCSCDASADPQIVLDPFGGSGTVAQVANRLNRRAVLIDLNPEYIEQQMKRASDIPLGLA